MALKWKILNPLMTTLRSGEFIESPEFGYDKFSFCFRFYPQGFDAKTELSVKPVRKDGDVRGITVAFHVEFRSCNMYQVLRPIFRMPSRQALHDTGPNDSERYIVMFPISDADVEFLDITCGVVSVDVSERLVEPTADDVEDLSTALLGLFTNDVASDFELLANSVNCGVHKTILEARTDNSIDDIQQHVRSHTYSAGAIRQFLKYIYSGHVDLECISDEVQTLFANVDHSPKRRLLNWENFTVSAETAVPPTQLEVLWMIDNFTQVGRSRVYSAIAGPPWSWLKLTFCTDNQRQHMLNINRFLNDRDVSLRCKVFVDVQEGILESVGSFSHVFMGEGDFNVKIDLEKERKNLRKDKLFSSGSLNLALHLEVFGGEHTTRITKTSYRLDINDHRRLFSERHLLEDMEALFLNHAGSDIIIKVAGQKFQVHKAILCAWSKVFHAMFENEWRENQTGEIDIGDIDVETVHSMLRYMYSTKLPRLTIDSTWSLYQAAQMYEVVPLIRKCSKIIKSLLSVENVCTILRLAHLHDDADLRSDVFSFVNCNARQVKDLVEWNAMMQSYPRLAQEFVTQSLNFIAVNVRNPEDTN